MSNSTPFADRHIGPRPDEERELLRTVGVESLDELIEQIVTEDVRLDRPLDLPEPVSETAALAELRELAQRNQFTKPMLGLGYHGCITPPVILRNLLENPAWYTSYTPYQAEISQGRLELLFHFQTLVCELTGHPVANASLLDEPTAVAEAAAMAVRHFRGKRTRLTLAAEPHPQTLAVLATRAESIGLEVSRDPPDESTAAVIVPWPDTLGNFPVVDRIVETAAAAGALTIAVADPLALVLLQPPAAWGADIVVGSMQRFGVPMGYGGPHTAYLATHEKLVRLVPGRIVGQSVDRHGSVAYRLALQTREQHIRREKATSNICTAQALLANMAAAYAIWHGADGLRSIAQRVHNLTGRLAVAAGERAIGDTRFDTVAIRTPGSAEADAGALRQRDLEPRVVDADTLSITFDETSTETDLAAVADALQLELPDTAPTGLLPAGRTAELLSQTVFHAHRSETSMMRYLQSLAAKDLALDRTMIPLGSCTMKLNAAAEMIPIGWPEFANMHPFTPLENAAGYRQLATDLENWLAEITGFDAVSLQPNAGSQGEYAGLLAIRRYHAANGGADRDICIIPDSAHGTNFASAALAGLEVVTVASREQGDLDFDDLKDKLAASEGRVAACMITYPSTRGVFDPGLRHLCRMIHSSGGQVYLDGANLNAMTGILRPGDVGADVCHMNLHKTFCIPHGGGGPGVGPIGVKQHLAPYLPGHWLFESDGAVAGAPLGSAGILPITWMYIRMMGAAGLRRASATAMLNANYISRRLQGTFPTAFQNENGFVAHECILDPRPAKASAEVSAEDIAKRLIDYGFHGPTMEWPVVGTLMVEPTESESKAELDRFCDAMLEIGREIATIASGEWPQDDNPLRNAPHTLADALSEPWNHPYPRSIGPCPPGTNPATNYFPPVARVDNAHGDRNLIISAPPQSTKK